jgi:CrcB protein
MRTRYVAVVGVGGAAGTAAREALSVLIPPVGALPLAILLINLAGALALGAILDSLVRRGGDSGRRRLVRLTVGTGFLGGFTTYSTLATGTALLLTGRNPGLAVAYAAGTLLLGAAATYAGIAFSAALHRRSTSESTDR